MLNNALLLMFNCFVYKSKNKCIKVIAIATNMASESSEIVAFYKNQTIFITGGTGFVGKVLIEKLLRDCDVTRIYVLVRPKKGKTTEERFNSLLDFPCFDRLKSEKTDFAQKIAPIDGDCEKPELGLSPDDAAILKKEVTCYIHAAANVKFDQSLRVAAANAMAVRDSIKLAKQMPLLKSFVFVSTAYSNCIHPYIGEKFYDAPISGDELFALLEDMDDETLEKATSRILGPYPNTYIYTKCIAESIVKEESKELPAVAIVRPAIVTSTLAEPRPGWIDNFYGVNGIVAAAALGVLRSLHANIDGRANLVPCDFVANLILAATWYATNSNDKKKIPIFNFVGSKKYPITWRTFMAYIETCAWDYPSTKQVWYYCFKLRKNYYWHRICVFFLHTLVAYIVDFFLIICGRAPIAVKNYARLDRMLSYLSYFTTNCWFFGTKNVETLWENMGEKDREIFKFTGEDLDILKYCRESVEGGRLYLLKEKMDTIPQGQRKLHILRIAHYTVVALFYYCMFKFCMYLIKKLYYCLV